MPESDTQEEQDESEYPFAGIPLMPEAIRELVLELYSGKTIRRNDIVTRIPEVHSERGGAAATSSNLVASVKKALQYLKREGLATNPGYGMWRIGSASDTDGSDDVAEDSLNEDLDDARPPISHRAT